MIPIIYSKDETQFSSNGLGRLRDCLSAVVTEQRNGIYELDFDYPIEGANFDLIQIGRIVGATHDDTGDIQPFDIVSYSKPLNGIITFHAVHISYRQSYLSVSGRNINSLSDAFYLLSTAKHTNPFVYQTDKTSSGYLAAADGIPKTVRQFLGGVDGSILDTYGGEYEWDKFIVKLWENRGQVRDFTIRYGVNMLNFNEDCESQGTYSSCIPYWTDGTQTVVAPETIGGSQTVTGRGECVPLDLTEKFETAPTQAQLQSMAQSYMSSNQTYLPVQNIRVEFIRIQDMNEYENFKSLLVCNLCDTINVIFPDYNSSGKFKIVQTKWNVLEDRYDSMELGALSTTLSEALGISTSLDRQNATPPTPDDWVVDEGTSGQWKYRKWNSGILEQWYEGNPGSYTLGTQRGNLYSGGAITYNYPIPFTETPRVFANATLSTQAYVVWAQASVLSLASVDVRIVSGSSISSSNGYNIHIYAVGLY